MKQEDKKTPHRETLKERTREESQEPVSAPKREPKPELRKEQEARLEEKQPTRPLVQEAKEVSVQAATVPLMIQFGPTLRSYKQLPVTIGKGPRCQFILDHPAVYDQHAQIFFNQNQYWVKDLTGQKLVQVNRQAVGVQVPLNPNDELALTPQGPTFQFLGEGRLAEMTEPSLEKSTTPAEKKEETQGKSPDAKSGKGFFSKFKKLIEP